MKSGAADIEIESPFCTAHDQLYVKCTLILVHQDALDQFIGWVLTDQRRSKATPNANSVRYSSDYGDRESICARTTEVEEHWLGTSLTGAPPHIEIKHEYSRELDFSLAIS